MMKIDNMIFEDSNETFNRLNYYCSKMNEQLKDFLGFDTINFEVLQNENNAVEFIIDVKDFYLPFINQIYEELFSIIENKALEIFSLNNFSNIQNYIEQIAFSILLKDQKEKVDGMDFFDFIDELKELSYLTYEGATVDIGIYVVKDEDSLKLFKNEKHFDYIEINPIDIKELMISEKPLVKLINNLHYNIIVNWDYKVVGIIKKKSFRANLKEIHNEMQLKAEKNLFIKSTLSEIEISFKNQFENNYVHKMAEFLQTEDLISLINDKTQVSIVKEMNSIFNEVYLYIKSALESKITKIDRSSNSNSSLINSLFINIKNKELYLWNNNYYPLVFKKGKWKLTNYIHLAHEINASRYLSEKRGAFSENSIYPDISSVSFDIMKTLSFNKQHKKGIEKILTDKIKQIESDTDSIFKLISIISNMSNNRVGGLFVIKTDEEYFKDNLDNILSNRNSNAIYRKLIKQGDKSPNIKQLDLDNVSLIASIDGTTILNRDFTIYSYTEMIKPQVLDTKYIGTVYGARTLAAVNATKFGLSIKVSEDGEISLFRNVVHKTKNGLSSIPMKVFVI